ncbi:unnamed protein product, partial [Protopolystoma xenopodis]
LAQPRISPNFRSARAVNWCQAQASTGNGNGIDIGTGTDIGASISTSNSTGHEYDRHGPFGANGQASSREWAVLTCSFNQPNSQPANQPNSQPVSYLVADLNNRGNNLGTRFYSAGVRTGRRNAAGSRCVAAQRDNIRKHPIEVRHSSLA